MIVKNMICASAIIFCVLLLTGCDDELFGMKDSKDMEDRTPVVGDPNATPAAIEVFRRINKEREKKKLYPLEWNPTLARVARMHSLDQAKRETLTHRGADGSDIENRVNAAKIRWIAIAENVGRNKGFGNPPAVAVDEWMKSPGHRRNILRRAWTDTGVGEVISYNGYTYFTQVFRQRPER